MSEPGAAPVTPVAAQERLLHIDVIRGMALLGVLVMNLHFWFRAPIQRYRLQPHPWPEAWNVGTDWGLKLFVEGKAMSAFAMLFAVGLAIQMERAQARGLPFWTFGLRRLAVLFLFGLAHLVLIWNGDILHTYALAGCLCLCFLQRKPRTIRIWFGALCAVAIACLLKLSFQALHGAGPQAPAAEAAARLQRTLQETLSARGQGSWRVESAFRLREWVQQEWPGAEIITTLGVFMLFLAGLAIWKTGILRDPTAFRSRIRACWRWTLPVGLAMALIGLLKREPLPLLAQHWRQIRYCLPLVEICGFFGPLILTLAWTSGVLLLLQKPGWSRRLAPFAEVGRMALSNYLAQSLAMTFLFCGWGLGLYNQLGPLAGVAVALGFFALQVAGSRWWLARFRFGPMEWAWRCLTYGNLQPLRASQSRTAEAPPRLERI